MSGCLNWPTLVTASLLVLVSAGTQAADTRIMSAASAALSIQNGVRVQVSPVQRAVISAELSGKISKMPWRIGQAVKADQLLVAFDCRSYQAQLAEAQAQRKEAAANLDTLRRLSDLQASSQLEQQQAQARLEQSDARVSLQQTLVDRCEIRAPFSARIANVLHQAHEVVGPGDKLLELVSDQELEVDMIVPSAMLKSLPKGKRFSLHLDELGQALTAEVVRSGGVIDPVSQSVQVYGRLLDAPSGILPGMSGLAQFDSP